MFARLGLKPAQAGTHCINLTGAPVPIPIGSKDSDDNGTAHRVQLAQSVNPRDRVVRFFSRQL